MAKRKNALVDSRKIKYSEQYTRNDINKFIIYDSHTGKLKWIDHYHPVHKKALTGKEAGTLSRRGYLEVTFLNKKIRCHNIAWYLHHKKWPSNYLDHINRVKTDNRIENLRDVTHLENMQNIVYERKSVTGYFGVSIDFRRLRISKKLRTNKLYFAYNGKSKIGRYESAVIAAMERDKFILKNELKRQLNFPSMIEDYENEIR